jgi:tyrosine-protein kinase Etk/Wzc
LSGLEAKYASVQQSIDELNERLAGYPTIQNRLNTLQVELQATERNIIALSDARQEADVQMTSEASEVKVLAPATVPDRPVAPIKIYHVGLAALLALLVSVGLVMVIDYLREGMALAPAKISADPIVGIEHPTELQKGRVQIG